MHLAHKAIYLAHKAMHLAHKAMHLAHILHLVLIVLSCCPPCSLPPKSIA
jgi:hypothetical protein